MAIMTIDDHVLTDAGFELVVRRQATQQLCPCGRRIAQPAPDDQEARPKRPEFEGQWRTLLYI